MLGFMALFFISVGLAFIVLPLLFSEFSDFEQVVGAAGGAVSLLGGFYFLGMAITRWLDASRKPISVTGSVARKSTQDWSEAAEKIMVYYILVAGLKFTVSKEIYHSCSEGDAVQVTYWPHSKVVVRVDLVTP